MEEQNAIKTIFELHHDGLAALTAMQELLAGSATVGPMELEPCFIALRNAVDSTREELEELYAGEMEGLDDLLIRQHLENNYQLQYTILNQLTYKSTYEELTAVILVWETKPFLRQIPS